MSDEESDYLKTRREVIEKLMLAGWMTTSLSRGADVSFDLSADARQCIRKVRAFVEAFGDAGIEMRHQWMFFKILADDTFADDDWPADR